MKKKNIYPIRYVAQKTGLSTHLIRIWERRHQAVVPKRTETNRRMFSEENIKRLQMLKMAVNVGHSISQIANLSYAELMQLTSSDASDASRTSAELEKGSLDATYFYEKSLAAVRNLNAENLESVLDEAAVHLTKVELIDALIVPLSRKIGELWKQGKLKIINEHMCTTVIRSFLWNLVRSAEVSQSPPKIVVATPAGQLHELGALAIALLACETDWQPMYFGPNLPAEEIAAAVTYVGARVVALSLTYPKDNHQLNLEIRKLRRYLTKEITILIGGQGAPLLGNFLGALKITIIEDIAIFRNTLDNLRRNRYD